ncbi:MAG: hypothetical protein OQL19_19095 [Gammaproteobacteria bacterium]|nr:hypothetical protein [Gammaproteobacteria bacterium]
MYIEHHSAISQHHAGFRAIKESISNLISFWRWERKLSKQYNDIMKHRKARSVREASDV